MCMGWGNALLHDPGAHHHAIGAVTLGEPALGHHRGAGGAVRHVAMVDRGGRLLNMRYKGGLA